MQDTLSYYDRHAAQFCRETADVDMSTIRERFRRYLPAGAAVLDAGCGSGRDAAAFAAAGYRVSAFDGAPRLAAMARDRLGFDVAVARFENLALTPCYDGIWACASLLHVPAKQLGDVLTRLSRGLRLGGVLYASFKHGSGERSTSGRHFTDLNEQGLAELLEKVPVLGALEIWTSPDQRPGRHHELWLNSLLQRRVQPCHAT